MSGGAVASLPEGLLEGGVWFRVHDLSIVVAETGAAAAVAKLDRNAGTRRDDAGVLAALP